MKNNQKKITVVTILLLLLIAIGSWFYIKQTSDMPLIDFDKSAKTYKSKIKKPEEWSEDKIAFPAFKEVTVVQGSKKFYMALENPSFNEAYLQFTLTLNGEGTPFYETGLVKPGEAVTEVPMPANLGIGNHIVKLSMKAYAPNDKKTKLNGTNVNFVLRVLEKGE